jgi:hypothetical protein
VVCICAATKMPGIADVTVGGEVRVARSHGTGGGLYMGGRPLNARDATRSFVAVLVEWARQARASVAVVL